MTVFVSSHLLFEVEQICTHVTIINHGEALVSDTLQNVSGMISGPATMQVEAVNLSDTAIAAIKSLAFVKDVSRSGNMLTIVLTTREDVRAEVSQAITGAGGIIVGMSLKGHSLEDVFIQLIGKPQGGKT
jgi:ABC-2 type transport system ATP-binding protein